MAKNGWLGTTSTSPALGANWLTTAVPTDADEIDIDGRAQRELAGADQSSIEPAVLRIYRSARHNVGTNSLGTITPWSIGPAVCHIGLPGEGGANSSGPGTIALD